MGRRSPFEQVRAICLALPETYEQVTWDDVTFRVRKKIFCMPGDHDGPRTVTLKTTPEDQAALLDRGDPYFYPAYVGSKGWIGVDLCAPALDWPELAELIRDSYRLIAPRTLGRLVTGPATPTPPGT